MKILVVYSSKTGNTKKIADAIFEILPEPKEIYSVQDAPPPEGYDFIAVGFWVNKGTADNAAQKYMKTIKGKKVGLFATLGAYPNSMHAKESMANGKELLTGNEILAEFICQGKVDPDLLARMPKDGPHAMTPVRIQRLDEAKKHPNETDCLYAQNAFREILPELV